MPSNREWVLLGLVAVGLVAALVWPTGRSSLASILRFALSRQLVVPYLSLAAWAAVIVWLGWRLEIWDYRLTTTTVISFVTTGTILFGKAAGATVLTKPDFLRRTVVATIGAAAILSAYTSIMPFPLAVETVLALALLFAGLLYAVAAGRSEYAGCAMALNVLFVLVVLGEVLYVSANLATSSATTDWRGLFEGVLLPIWLTIGLLPAAYVLASFSIYESAVTRVVLARLPSDLTRSQRRRAWLALTIEFRLRSEMVGAFGGQPARNLGNATSLREARSIVRGAGAEMRANAPAHPR